MVDDDLESSLLVQLQLGQQVVNIHWQRAVVHTQQCRPFARDVVHTHHLVCWKKMSTIKKLAFTVKILMNQKYSVCVLILNYNTVNTIRVILLKNHSPCQYLASNTKKVHTDRRALFQKCSSKHPPFFA